MTPYDPLLTAPLWGSCRMTLAVICFLGVINTYAQRINLSVAIVCMVNQTAARELDLQHVDEEG